MSTNEGGTKELCAVGPDGFDGNAAVHFRAMAWDLNTPKILVCPQDKGREPAADFQSLRPENVSYRMRSGTNITEGAAQEVLLVCPIHGNVLRCNGDITVTNEPPPNEKLEYVRDVLSYNVEFDRALLEVSGLVSAGLVFYLAGRFLRARARDRR